MVYHTKYVIPGLLVFVGLALLPTFLGRGKSADVALSRPTNADECVEDARIMRARHMQLLNDWRNAVVREGRHVYTNAKGRTYVMSLTGTCLGCHSKAEFCDRCHTAMDVSPTCWNCHIVPASPMTPPPALAQGSKP